MLRNNQNYPPIPIRPVFEMTILQAYVDMRKRLDSALALEVSKYEFEKELSNAIQ